ncbi:MAG: hypothetical protein U0W40_17045 [Acidimicrobiia bacterium]
MTSIVDWLARQHAFVLFLVILLLILVIAAVFVFVAERVFDEDARGRTSGSVTTAVGVVAAIYAVIVAFVIVNEWAAFADAQTTVSDESAALVAVYSSASVLPEPGRTEIQKAVIAYDRSVVCFELPRLATHDGPAPESVAALHHLYETVAANPADSPFYGNVVSSLDDLVTARRERINAAVSPLPNLLLVVIVVISLALLATIAALDTRHRRWHYLITAIVGLIVALNLTLVISLDRPFSGAAKVSDAPYREGVLDSLLNCSPARSAS